MDKRTIIGIAVLIVIGVIWYLMTPMPMSNGYTAISTSTNQFFVGRAYHTSLSRFVQLREPFLLQNLTDAENNSVTPQLVDLTVESYWLPETIYISMDSIVLKGEVGPESAIAVRVDEYKSSGVAGVPAGTENLENGVEQPAN